MRERPKRKVQYCTVARSAKLPGNFMSTPGKVLENTRLGLVRIHNDVYYYRDSTASPSRRKLLQFVCCLLGTGEKKKKETLARPFSVIFFSSIILYLVANDS